ncbi:MAG: ABC transporter permease, partial [Miltoncostaeaceae bacterium]
IVGWVDDTNYLLQNGLWVEPDTWREVQNRNRPDAPVVPGEFQTLVVRTDDGANRDDVLVAIDAATGTTETLTIDQAISELPGVEQQQSTFNQIIGVTVVVALVVIALFFALLTVERTALYGVLKALGARSRTLFLGLMVQAVILTAIASAIGAAMVLVIDGLIPPGSIPLYVAPSRLVLSAILLVLAAIVGCAFSLRRVLRVDPASALGSSS